MVARATIGMLCVLCILSSLRKNPNRQLSTQFMGEQAQKDLFRRQLVHDTVHLDETVAKMLEMDPRELAARVMTDTATAPPIEPSKFALNRHLRLAVFGTKASYGMELENRFDAFPYLLSPTVDNFAHYDNYNLDYFATCTQTVLGDKKLYDVFIIEYWLRYYLGLEDLVRKIRSRFPKAMIILVKIWTPDQFRRRTIHSRSKPHSFDQWKLLQGMNSSTKIVDVIQAIRDDEEGEWYYPSNENADRSLDAIAAKYAANLYSFPFLPHSLKNTLMSYIAFFDQETHSKLNVWGHVAMARNLNTFFHSLVPLGVQSQLNRRVFGTWGRGDHCNLWYTTGAIDFMYSQSTISLSRVNDTDHFYSPRSMDAKDNHPSHQHFALEIYAPGWLDVHNPFYENRTLYLTMLSSKEKAYYPRVTVQWDHNWVEVNPRCGREVKTRTMAVGQVRYGTTRLVFLPLENSTKPFGLLGWSITDETKTPREMDFGKIFDPVVEDMGLDDDFLNADENEEHVYVKEVTDFQQVY